MIELTPLEVAVLLLGLVAVLAVVASLLAGQITLGRALVISLVGLAVPVLGPAFVAFVLLRARRRAEERRRGRNARSTPR